MQISTLPLSTAFHSILNYNKFKKIIYKIYHPEAPKYITGRTHWKSCYVSLSTFSE